MLPNRMGFKARLGSLWVGAHWSSYNKRLCVNILPCLTIWFVWPGGVGPDDHPIALDKQNTPGYQIGWMRGYLVGRKDGQLIAEAGIPVKNVKGVIG